MRGQAGCVRFTHQVCSDGALCQHEGAFWYQEYLDIWEAWWVFAQAVSFQHVPAASVGLLHLHSPSLLSTQHCVRARHTGKRWHEDTRFYPLKLHSLSHPPILWFIALLTWRATIHTSKLHRGLSAVCAGTLPPRRRARTCELSQGACRDAKERLARNSLSRRMFSVCSVSFRVWWWFLLPKLLPFRVFTVLHTQWLLSVSALPPPSAHYILLLCVHMRGPGGAV